MEGVGNILLPHITVDPSPLATPISTYYEPALIEPEPNNIFPTITVIAVASAVPAIVGIGLMVYFKKRKQ